MARLDFDATTVDPSSSFDPIPAGKYLAIATESETKATKSGSGHYLEVVFQIIEGEHKDRLLWARFNLQNPNQQAVEIAKKELSALCHAVGVLTPKDSSDLHGIPLILKVGCKHREDTDEISNEIKGYESRKEAQGQPPQAPAATSPWRR